MNGPLVDVRTNASDKDLSVNQIKKINPGLAKEDYKFGLQTGQIGQTGQTGQTGLTGQTGQADINE